MCAVKTTAPALLGGNAVMDGGTVLMGLRNKLKFVVSRWSWTVELLDPDSKSKKS